MNPEPHQQPTLIKSNLAAALEHVLLGRVCIVGVGNRWRGDDGAGPRVIDGRRQDAGGVWIDAGITLENFLEPIVASAPDTILLVDAVNFGGCPGQWRLMAEVPDRLVVSTHAVSIDLAARYLSVRAAASLYVLGIQPTSMHHGNRLSVPVARAVSDLASALSEVLSDDSLNRRSL